MRDYLEVIGAIRPEPTNDFFLRRQRGGGSFSRWLVGVRPFIFNRLIWPITITSHTVTQFFLGMLHQLLLSLQRDDSSGRPFFVSTGFSVFIFSQLLPISTTPPSRSLRNKLPILTHLSEIVTANSQLPTVSISSADFTPTRAFSNLSTTSQAQFLTLL